MCENNLTNKKTPLRNSNLANKPFRSPLTTVSTPKNNDNSKNILHESPAVRKSETPKRSIYQCRYPIKRRRIDEASRDSTIEDDDEKIIDRRDLLAVKIRVRTKKQELANLKRELHYLRKHKSEDLTSQINKWRDACKEALLHYRKIIVDNATENITMKQILATLSIPAEIVKFTEEECDMT